MCDSHLPKCSFYRELIEKGRSAGCLQQTSKHNLGRQLKLYTLKLKNNYNDIKQHE